MSTIKYRTAMQCCTFIVFPLQNHKAKQAAVMETMWPGLMSCWVRQQRQSQRLPMVRDLLLWPCLMFVDFVVDWQLMGGISKSLITVVISRVEECGLQVGYCLSMVVTMASLVDQESTDWALWWRCLRLV
jgi:hypothetical protein